MSITITGKLNRQAREFQAGQSIGFGFTVGVSYYDRQAKSKEWANYEAAVFSNNSNQIDFLRSALVEGSVVEVTAAVGYPSSREHEGVTYLSIKLDDCKLGYVHTGQAQQPQQAPQQAPQRAPQQAPQNQSQGGYDNNGQYQAPRNQPAPPPQGQQQGAYHHEDPAPFKGDNIPF